MNYYTLANLIATMGLLFSHSPAHALFGSAEEFANGLAKDETSLVCNIEPKTRARFSEEFLKDKDLSNWLWQDDSRGKCMGNQKLWLYLNFAQNYPKQPASDIDLEVSSQNPNLSRLSELSTKATLVWKQMLACGAKAGLTDEQVRRRYVIGNGFCGSDTESDREVFSQIKNLKLEVTQFLDTSEMNFDVQIAVHPLLSEMVLQAMADNSAFYGFSRRKTVNGNIFINATNYMSKMPQTCNQWGLFPVISKEIMRSARVVIDDRITYFTSVGETVGDAIYRATEHCDPRSISRMNTIYGESARKMIIGVRNPNEDLDNIDKTFAQNRDFLGVELQSISRVYQADYLPNIDDGSKSLEIRKSVGDKFSIPRPFKGFFKGSRFDTPDLFKN